MRARGAKVTDIAIIIVAADEIRSAVLLIHGEKAHSRYFIPSQRVYPSHHYSILQLTHLSSQCRLITYG